MGKNNPMSDPSGDLRENMLVMLEYNLYPTERRYPDVADCPVPGPRGERCVRRGWHIRHARHRGTTGFGWW